MDTNVHLNQSVIDTYFWRVIATDGIDNVSSLVRNFTYARWSIVFNVTSGEFTREGLNNVSITACNYTGFNQSGDPSNTYGPYGFPPGDWQCTFIALVGNFYDKTKIFTADSDKIVDVTMSEEASLTDQEHTWLEAIYNCMILKDCDLYNLLLQINQSTANTWQHIKPTDESVITTETQISNTLNSTQNITYDYAVSIPIKAGYNLGAYLPVRIGFWFLNASNTSCYNQGTLPTGASLTPYCNPLMIQTIGPMGGSINFRVDLRPNLTAGTYNVKRIIEIDPQGIWTGYGQEVIDTVTVTENMLSSGSIGLDKTGENFASTGSAGSPSGAVSAGGGGGGGGSGGGSSRSSAAGTSSNGDSENNAENPTVINNYNTYVNNTYITENYDEKQDPGGSGLSGITGALVSDIVNGITSNISLIGIVAAISLLLSGVLYNHIRKNNSVKTKDEKSTFGHTEFNLNNKGK